MKSIMPLIIAVLMVIVFLPLDGEKREEPLSIDELTNPESPSFVPIPYPKNRKEILVDLKYYIKKYNDSEGAHDTYADGFTPTINCIEKNLISSRPAYKIGKIIKVKNQISSFSDDYTWLIYIMDKNDNLVMRMSLLKSGLFCGSGMISDDHIKNASSKTKKKLKRLQHVLTEKDVKALLSETLLRDIAEGEIKKMDRVAYLSTMGDFLVPMWEITMSDNSIYYYSESRHSIYRISHKIPWEKSKMGYRPARRSLVLHNDYLPDHINDCLVVLDKLKTFEE